VLPAAPLPPPTQRRQGPGASDRFFTIFLLGFALFSLATSIPGYLGFGAVMAEALKQAGYGTFDQVAAADRAGYWLLAVHVVLLGLTILLSVRQLRRRRMSFYIPIIGAVVFAIVSVVIVYALVQSDPAFMAHIAQRVQSGS
jgi:hypothetical protein